MSEMNHNSKTKHTRSWKLAIPFFLVMTVLTVVSFLIPLRPTESYNEKRKLAEFPAFSWEALVSGDYFDDIADSFAREYINSLYERGIVGGKDVGVFAPDDYVTRQQFAAMLYRALGLNDADYEDVELPFADQKKLSSYAVTPVKALYSLGILNGSSTGGKLYVSPHEPLSRAQACAFVARAMGVSSEETPDFSDPDSFPSYAPAYVGALSELGIIGGYKDGSFRPRNYMTREQMCKVLYLMLENQQY